MRYKGKYRHYKGGYYKVLHIAKHTSTGNEYVVYKSLKSGEVFIRPYFEFFGRIDRKGEFYKCHRFERQVNFISRFIDKLYWKLIG